MNDPNSNHFFKLSCKYVTWLYCTCHNATNTLRIQWALAARARWGTVALLSQQSISAVQPKTIFWAIRNRLWPVPRAVTWGYRQHCTPLQASNTPVKTAHQPTHYINASCSRHQQFFSNLTLFETSMAIKSALFVLGSQLVGPANPAWLSMAPGRPPSASVLLVSYHPYHLHCWLQFCARIHP